MEGRISFRINYEKAIEALVYLANQKPGIDIYHVAKVLFFADKLHVNRFARPILGDTYICMDHGPVPSGVRNLIADDSWLSQDLLDRAGESIAIEHKPYRITAKRRADIAVFSESDLECLDWSLREYGSKSFAELRALTHEERCYIDAGANEPIDYRSLVDEDNPNRDRIIEEMEESAAYATL